KTRVAQQYPTLRPGALPYKIVLEESAMHNDGSTFSDHDVHRYLKKAGIKHKAGEWFECTIKEVKASILALKSGEKNEDNRTLDFCMRPEQVQAVDKTITYFKSYTKENPDKTPHFLWNAKMRFGKTFASYQLAKKRAWKKILVLTFKPAVQSAWDEDLQTHIDFKGWQFISRNGLHFEDADKTKPFVCFGSFQDYLGKNDAGGIKARNEWVHTTNWDCVIFDEYHYGAWRENAKELFEAEGKKELEFGEGEGMDYFEEGNMPITTNSYLYLSGTPFRAIASGEFIEEQIFNWTYSDEQKAKENWASTSSAAHQPNPYASLPRMVMLTYQLPDSLREVAMKGEFNEFDLNFIFVV
ncbi:MAG: DEAD/DEAH box helicase family protein, partial [Flavobacteriaceae bacterium]|nr:DEAD/DEAH box helicase family protein [Flavobacteriaceae bacterium]